MATPSKSVPKIYLTLSIHSPAFGTRYPAPNPSKRSGTPIPSAKKNIVKAPKTGSLVEIATDKNEINIGETHAPKINAEINPSTNTIPRLPPLMPCDSALSLDCIKEGSWMVNNPNIDRAINTKIKLIAPIAQTFWKYDCSCSPVAPAKAPMTA